MKITKKQLNQIIKEELRSTLSEQGTANFQDQLAPVIEEMYRIEVQKIIDNITRQSPQSAGFETIGHWAERKVLASLNNMVDKIITPEFEEELGADKKGAAYDPNNPWKR